MTASDLWSTWTFWMIVAGAVVLIAATLLITIWLTARSILAHAGRALAAAEEIRQNTLVIWELKTTNEVAEDLLSSVQAIEEKGGKMAAALESHAGAGG